MSKQHRTLYEDVRADLEKELIPILRRDPEFGFCLIEPLCPSCIELKVDILDLALKYAGFDTRTLEDKARELQLDKVRD